MLKAKRCILVVLNIVLCLLVSGCWDKVEINDRDFVIGLGIDKAGHNEYNVICAVPNLPVYTGKSSGGEPKFIKAAEASTISGAYKKLTSRLNKQLNFEHVDVIIIGEEVIEDKHLFKETIDHFNRNTMYSLTIPVLVAPNQALDIFEIKPEGAGTVGSYIADVYKNNSEHILTSTALNLSELYRAISENEGTVLMPKVSEGDNDVNIEGAVVIANYNLKGWLDNEEVRCIGWLTGKASGSQFDISFKDQCLSYEISDSQASAEFSLEEDRLKVDITIKAEGRVREYYYDSDSELFDVENLNMVKDQLENYMVGECNKLIKKLQDEYEAEVIGLLDKLKMENKEIYLMMKDDWNQYFSVADISVKSILRIRRIGDIK